MSCLKSLGLTVGILASTVSGSIELLSASSATAVPPQLVSLSFPDSPGGSGPGRTAGGGARGDCIVEKDGSPQMTVLMPSNNVGTTVSPDPALFLYIPAIRSKKSLLVSQGAEVSVVDREGNEVYFEKIALPNRLTDPASSDTAVIVRLSLEGANLKRDRAYDWTFAPFCVTEGELEPSYAEILEGTLERKNLTPSQQEELKQARTPFERASTYAKAGIWHEALMILAELRADNPADWEAFLASVQLQELAQTPIYDVSPVAEP